MFFEDDESGVSAAELTKQSLVDTQARMGIMLDLMPMGLLIHTQQGVIFANQEASRLLRVSQDRIVGLHFLDFLQTKVVEATAHIDEAFAGRTTQRAIEAELQPTDGPVRTVKMIVGALPWVGNPVVQILIQDVTDLKAVQDELLRLTVTDELTGAYNRRHAFRMGEALYACPISSEKSGLAIFDIDHFKRINDTYGHASGDIALKALVKTVSTLTALHPAQITFARVGGEEFVLLVGDTSPEKMSELCERLRSLVEQVQVVSPTGTFRMTVSVGVCCYPVGSFDEAFAAADSALYCAKREGRNRICSTKSADKKALA